MTSPQQVLAWPGIPPSRTSTRSIGRSETVGDYNLAVVEHFRADGSGPGSFSITRSRMFEDGTLGRQVSYGLSGFDDFDSARDFGIAWCGESAELQSA